MWLVAVRPFPPSSLKLEQQHSVAMPLSSSNKVVKGTRTNDSGLKRRQGPLATQDERIDNMTAGIHGHV